MHEVDAMRVTPPTQGLAVELRRVIEMNAIRLAPDRPRPIQMSLGQPGVFLEHRVGEAQTRRDGRGGF
jgi:hypothetical protein